MCIARDENSSKKRGYNKRAIVVSYKNIEDMEILPLLQNNTNAESNVKKIPSQMSKIKKLKKFRHF